MVAELVIRFSQAGNGSYPVYWPSMQSCKMVQHSVRDDAVLPSTVSSSPIGHLLAEVFSWYVSVAILIKVPSLVRVAVLTSAVANHASTHCWVTRMSVLMGSVSVVRLTFIPFCEVHLTVSIVRRRCSLIIIVALVVILEKENKQSAQC